MKIDYKTTKMTIDTPPSDDSGLYSADVDLKHNLIWVSYSTWTKSLDSIPKLKLGWNFPWLAPSRMREGSKLTKTIRTASGGPGIFEPYGYVQW